MHYTKIHTTSISTLTHYYTTHTHTHTSQHVLHRFQDNQAHDADLLQELPEAVQSGELVQTQRGLNTM